MSGTVDCPATTHKSGPIVYSVLPLVSTSAGFYTLQQNLPHEQEYECPPQNPDTMKKMKYKQQKCWLALLAFAFCSGLLICLYAIRTTPYLNQYRIVRSFEAFPDTQTTRTILHWNGFFGDERWGLPDDTLGPSFLRDELQCPIYQCEITNNPNFLPAIDMFDALLFHAAEAFPLLKPVPRQRSAAQLYVFALMEPPGETKHILGDEGGFYNLTMTHRLDSDIVWPYQTIVDKESNIVVAPAKYPTWREPPNKFNDTKIWSLWPGKTKTAAWFVSHCETLSEREKLAASMQKYIDVDIYGKCGTLSCPRDSNECDEMLDRQYKFYFAFENSLCNDYVSEKFFNAMQRQLIPVVFGGANYTHFAPPHSYINAEDFESTQKLAAYLQYLSNNPAEYMSYFWWRSYYRLGYKSPYCDLCERLHSSSFTQKTQSYTNIERWWLQGSCRFKARIDF